MRSSGLRKLKLFEMRIKTWNFRTTTHGVRSNAFLTTVSAHCALKETGLAPEECLGLVVGPNKGQMRPSRPRNVSQFHCLLCNVTFCYHAIPQIAAVPLHWATIYSNPW